LDPPTPHVDVLHLASSSRALYLADCCSRIHL
jgi:hypothetical protein